ncbi:MAG: hypothetical protein ACR2OC_08540 [Solirubrobacterales bacterium]
MASPTAERRSRRRPTAVRRRRPEVDLRSARLVLGVAIAVAIAVLLYEARDTTLFNDEVELFESLAVGFDAETIMRPRNGHLLAVSNLIYQGVFSAFGPDYIVLRLIGGAGIAALSLLLFAYCRRRVGAWLGLAPAVIVLFLGASWETLLWPLSVMTFVFALTAGIGALLMIDRRDGRGDIAACLLLVFAVACHSVGLPFVVGVAVMLLWRKRNRGRAWVFLVPLLLWLVWWIWAMQFDDPSALRAANVWLIPAYAAEALAIVLASVTGLGATISGEGLNPTVEIETGWGRVLALAAIVGLAIRITRRRIPIELVATLAILATYWTLTALSLGPDRAPDESRYILPGAVLVFLVVVNALQGIKLPRAATIAVLVVTLVSVSTGIRQLHDGALFLRDYSVRAQATASGVEQATATVPGNYEPSADPNLEGVVPPQFPLSAGRYFDGASEFGSLAFTSKELAGEPSNAAIAEQVRIAAISAGAGVDPPEVVP